jgi:hypothetical protein
VSGDLVFTMAGKGRSSRKVVSRMANKAKAGKLKAAQIAQQGPPPVAVDPPDVDPPDVDPGDELLQDPAAVALVQGQGDNLPPDPAAAALVPPDPAVTDLDLSASSKKLKLDDSVNIDNKDIPSNSNFIMNLGCLQKLVQPMKCEDCGSPMRVNAQNKNLGYAIRLTLNCSRCNTPASEVLSSKRSADRQIEVNQRVSSGFMALGLGHSASETFSMHLNMPSMSKNAFRKNCKSFIRKTTPAVRVNLRRAREKVREYYISQDPSLADKKYINIVVSFDGSWMKRGHRSLYGFAAVIEVHTGLVVDYVTLSKYCFDCVVTKQSFGKDYANDPDYDIWYKGHKATCGANVDLEMPSGNMEVEAAKRLWSR